jgi:hypothetical protein
VGVKSPDCFIQLAQALPPHVRMVLYTPSAALLATGALKDGPLFAPNHGGAQFHPLAGHNVTRAVMLRLLTEEPLRGRLEVKCFGTSHLRKQFSVGPPGLLQYKTLHAMHYALEVEGAIETVMVGSANPSLEALGVTEDKGVSWRTNSFELGVLLSPAESSLSAPWLPLNLAGLQFVKPVTEATIDSCWLFAA